MSMDFKSLADYVPVMVAVVGVANTLIKFALKKGVSEDKGGFEDKEEYRTDLDVITAQLEEVIGLLKNIAGEAGKNAELQKYLERCREEKAD
jgi:hypothetical protein